MGGNANLVFISTFPSLRLKDLENASCRCLNLDLVSDQCNIPTLKVSRTRRGLGGTCVRCYGLEIIVGVILRRSDADHVGERGEVGSD